MISGVRGQIVSKVPGAVLVDLHGLILKVLTSQTTISDVGDPGDQAEFLTHLYVREDQLTLFGFATQDELDLFELLLTVSGVGPRVALSVLSTARPDEIHAAIESEDVNLLSRVPGIGKKTASRIIFDLRGKLPERVGEGVVPMGAQDQEALDALQSLGYSMAEARSALAGVDRFEGQTSEERVYAALQTLSRN
ncbi:MAG: Holliday junction branch migration protein RuvA [Nitrolancea sp.]